MMRMEWWLGVLVLLVPGVGVAQTTAPDVEEVPLRLESGRLVITVSTASGEADFVLGAAESRLSESGIARLGGTVTEAMIGGMPISLQDAQVVADDALFLDGGGSDLEVAGVIGGQSLMPYDVLIDVPAGRLVLKRPGRFVEWEGVPLSSAVPLQILHDFLIRTEVAVNGELFSAHMVLTTSSMLVSRVVRDRAGVSDGPADFRMGYSAFPGRPARFLDLPELKGWGGDDVGVVFIGAPVTYDCALAISWRHAEMRTCPR
ncbi:MAG: hypothetical protein ACR2QM_09490 [Longimicrobiales bacterium]